MNLGEKIYNLRMSKNLSQGDLAELLGVSRQSVSKWENNSAVPDLEKIIKLSDIFGVSIDDMVKGEIHCADKQTYTQQIPPKIEYVQVVQRPAMEGRKIAGTVLFCLAFVVTFGLLLATGSLGGIFYAIPFILCGIICFAVKKHTGLVCCWTLYVITDIFMQFATGASRGMALNTIHYLRAIGNININLIVSWIWLIITVVLVVRTAIVLRKTPVADMTKFKTKLLAGWVFYIALYAVRRVINALWFESVIIPFIQENNILYGLINTTINEGIFALLIILVVSTVRYVFNIKKMKL